MKWLDHTRLQAGESWETKLFSLQNTTKQVCLGKEGVDSLQPPLDAVGLQLPSALTSTANDEQ